VLGYWLGAEFVINMAFRRATLDSERPFVERDRFMDLVMDADQHVRRALLLQLMLGTLLMWQRGYLPTAAISVGLIVAASCAWLGLIELAHRWRKRPLGSSIAKLDRILRYLAILLLFYLAWQGSQQRLPIPEWLSGKLALFALVMSCGVAIRLILIRLFDSWQHLTETKKNNNTSSSFDAPIFSPPASWSCFGLRSSPCFS